VQHIAHRAESGCSLQMQYRRVAKLEADIRKLRKSTTILQQGKLTTVRDGDDYSGLGLLPYVLIPLVLCRRRLLMVSRIKYGVVWTEHRVPVA